LGGPPTQEEVIDGILEAMNIQAQVQGDHLQQLHRDLNQELLGELCTNRGFPSLVRIEVKV